MEQAVELIQSCVVGNRMVARVRLRDLQQEVYLLERLDRLEEAPLQTALSPAIETLRWEDRSYWVLLLPSSKLLADYIREGTPETVNAMRLARELGEGVLALNSRGLLPPDLYQHVYLHENHLVLDYPGALLEAAMAFSLSLALPGGAVPCLAAILHGLISGKPATDPPFVFLPSDGFRADLPPGLGALIEDGLRGRTGLVDFVERLGQLEAEERLARLFPPPVRRSLAGTGRPPIEKEPRRSVTVVMDLLLWLICTGIGLMILYIYQ